MLAIHFFGLYLKLFERNQTVSFASVNRVSSGYFIEMYFINRTLHARLWIRILSSRVDNIPQH